MIVSRILLGSALLVGCSDNAASARNDSHRAAGDAPVVANVPTSLRIARVNGTDTTEIGGDWSGAAEASIWTAYAFGGRLVRLQETSRDTADAPFARQYHFDADGRLAHYVEDRSLLAAEGNASPGQMRVHTVVAWPVAAPAVATRRVDGVVRPVQPWDLENVQRRADQLLSLARPGVPRP